MMLQLIKLLIAWSLWRRFKKASMTSTMETPSLTKKSKSNWRHGSPNNLVSDITARSTEPCKIYFVQLIAGPWGVSMSADLTFHRSGTVETRVRKSTL